MTLHKDHDPGWWRRGLSSRALIILVSICVVAIGVGLVVAVVNGMRLF